MTHEEAVARSKELSEDQPGRAFVVRDAGDGNWEVVGVTLPFKPTPAKRQAQTRAGPDVRPDPTESQSPPVHGQRGF